MLFVSIHSDHGAWHPLHHPQEGTIDECGTGDGRGYTVNIPVPSGMGDDGYVYVFDALVEPIVAQFDPDVILVSAGYVSLLYDENGVFHCSSPLYHIGGAVYRVTSMLVWGDSVALWDRYSTSSFWDRIEEYDVTSATLSGVVIDWLNERPVAPDDHETTLYKVDLQPLPGHLKALCRRFRFDLLTSSFGQTESGLSIMGAIRPTPGETRTPASLVRGKGPDEVVAALEEWVVPIVREPLAERWLGRARESNVRSGAAGRTERAGRGR